MMNKLDRLIAELCPDGVEHKPLSEVVEMKAGKFIQAHYCPKHKSNKVNWLLEAFCLFFGLTRENACFMGIF